VHSQTPFPDPLRALSPHGFVSPDDRDRASRPPAAHTQPASLDVAGAPAPAGVVEVEIGGRSVALWPFTTGSFPAQPQDPVNLIFIGRADPREIRAALLSLDGDRPGCHAAAALSDPATRWTDAIGEVQAAWSGDGGWAGSAIQLECGDYDGLRFHLRLFAAAGCTLASAHLDFAIPGTPFHEVISWELARRLVVYDLQRSGLLDETAPVTVSEPLVPPFFRQIRPEILRELGDLRTWLTETGSITPRGCLRTAERATVLHLAHPAPPPPERARHSVVVRMDTVVPLPFGAMSDGWIRLQGPLHLQQEVEVEPGGRLSARTTIAGDVRATPVDPDTRRPLGPVLRGHVSETHTAVITDVFTAVTMLQDRRLLDGDHGRQERVSMEVGPDDHVRYSREEREVRSTNDE
jgi:hypothetical protein